MRTFIFLLTLAFTMSGCNRLKKEYQDGQEAWNSVKDIKYDDIVEVWGKPDEIITYDDRVDAIWTSSKVKIKEGSFGDITLSFDKYYTPFGRIEGIGKPHDLDCGDWQYLDGHKMKIHYSK